MRGLPRTGRPCWLWSGSVCSGSRTALSWWESGSGAGGPGSGRFTRWSCSVRHGRPPQMQQLCFALLCDPQGVVVPKPKARVSPIPAGRPRFSPQWTPTPITVPGLSDTGRGSQQQDLARGQACPLVDSHGCGALAWGKTGPTSAPGAALWCPHCQPPVTCAQGHRPVCCLAIPRGISQLVFSPSWLWAGGVRPGPVVTAQLDVWSARTEAHPPAPGSVVSPCPARVQDPPLHSRVLGSEAPDSPPQAWLPEAVSCLVEVVAESLGLSGPGPP